MIRYFFTSLILLFFISDVSAQGTSSRRASKAYKDAQDYIASRDFERGIKMLQKAVEIDPDYYEAHYALAGNYSLLRYHEKAKYHYREAARVIPNNPDKINLYQRVASDYLQDGEYAKAKEFYSKVNQYAKIDAQRKVAIRGLAIIKFAENGMQNPLEFEPEKLPAIINARKLQYFAVLTADEEQIYFTARDDTKGFNDENILRSIKKDSVWQVPEKVTELNSPSNEGTCTISADGRTIIFTVCQNSGRPVIGECDLFVSYKEGDEWSLPKNMGKPINTQYWETQATLSADGRTLYYVSTRPGGFGGSDIWVTYRNADDTWQNPVNLGESINTAGDENSPFIHVNGTTLFFASDVHLGFGGFDLFMTEREPRNNWTKPRNLGYPINTHTDQHSLFVTADGKTAYYSDLRIAKNDILRSEIYKFPMPEEIQIKTISRYVKGTIYDAKTKEPLGASVDLYNLSTEEIQSSVRSDSKNGKYLFVLNEGANYALNVNKKGYLFKSLSFDYTLGGQGDVVVDIYLEKAEKGSKVVLNNIFFDTDKWKLKDESKTELELVVRYLKLNPEIKVQINGHTDDVGDRAYNQNLSEKRAQSVVDYLTNAGIPTTRIKARGYGETQPQVPNTSDANRAENRRIEFEIL